MNYERVAKLMENPKYRGFSERIAEISEKLDAEGDRLEILALMEESELLMLDAKEESKQLYDMLLSAHLGIRERGIKKLTGVDVILE